MSEEKSVLAIGDVQGHPQRLEGLLLQEGIIGPCGVCGGSGDVAASEEGPVEFCPACNGSGTARVRHDVTVISCGDLVDCYGHSRSADSVAIEFGNAWLDLVLFGNHDRPVVDPNPHILFGGFCEPLPTVKHRMRLMMHEGRYRLAYAAHGFLFTHAGMPRAWASAALPEDVERDDPGAVAQYLYDVDRGIRKFEHESQQRDFFRIRDSIGPWRGGAQQYGGLFWRDAHEKLYTGMRQVFGHSSGPKVRKYNADGGWSYCLDLSKHGKVGAIWLPDERIVEWPVDPTPPTR